MRTCSACGASLSVNARFCTRCGHEFGPPERTAGLSVAALIVACLPGCLFSLAGLVLGIAALRQVKATPGLKGRGLAKAAIVVSLCWGFGLTALLAALAIPSFNAYRERSQRQDEARNNLAAIHAAARSFEQGQGRKARDLAELGWAPASGRRYSYLYRQDVLAPDHGRKMLLPARLASEPAILDAEAVAIGDIDADPDLDVWVVDSSGAVFAVEDDMRTGR